MTDSGGWLAGFGAVLTGLILVLLGTAGLGLFLTFAGEGASTRAIIVAGAAFAFAACGFTLLVAAERRRGGLLRSRRSRKVAAVYRREYRKR